MAHVCIRLSTGLSLAALLALAPTGATAAVGYDYEVEYVRSARGSCVKTDLVPEPGLTFRLAVRFDGPFNPMFGGKFDLQKNTKAFFGSEEPEVEGVRSLFMLELGGNDAQTYSAPVSFGTKSKAGKWVHCGVQDLNESTIGSRIEITYDGRNLFWGPFRYKLDGERKEAGRNPLSFFGMTRPDGSVRSYACYGMSLYGATFYKAGKPVARFIPVVKGGVAGLYEEVSGKFYASVTDMPLQAGPRKLESKVGVGVSPTPTPTQNSNYPTPTPTQNSNFSLPVFEDDFTNPQVFAERWNFLGFAQKDIVLKDGAVRIPSGNTGDGISWKGDLPDEFAAEAVFVLYPAWSKIPDPKDGDYHWASMGCDYGNFGVCSDGNGVCLYTPAPGQPTRGLYPRIAGYKGGEPVTVRFERRKIGESMMGYAYIVNGVQLGYYTGPAPKKVAGFDGALRYKPLNIDCFQCPFEVRRVTIYALKGEDSANLIANSGFEFASDGVPPGWCNRSWFNAGEATVRDYTGKYLGSFRVDAAEKHSGRQSLKLTIGPFVRNFDFFSWNTPTQKGKSAVLSVWAKASEPGVPFALKLSDNRKTVNLATDWTRYEITTTNMPSPGIFSPVWFNVSDLAKRTTEAAIWLDDVQLEMVDAPEGGFDPGKTYATGYRPRAGDADNFAPPKAVPHPPAGRKVPFSPAENALCGYERPQSTPWPIKGLILGHYDFYMDEPKAEFRVWDDLIHAHGPEDPVFEEVAIDISALPPGTHEVTVRALGKDWKTTVVKRPYKKGATQVNQWSRTLVHDGKPVFMSAPCLIGRENAPRKDGTSTQIDILAEAGFKYLNLQNNLNVRDIEMNRQTLAYAAEKGMKFMLWTGEGELREVGDILRWEDNKPTDWSRQKMFDMLDGDDVLTVLVLDEPEYRKAADCQAYMKREKARFPYKPVQMNNSWLGISGRFAGLPTDILMIDYYLTTDGTTLDMVVAKVDVLRSIAPGKPCWYFMESENSLHPRIPSYKEQVAQCWGAVAAGATGLSWFVNLPTSRGCYDALVDINRELLDNTDFLCSDELCGGAVTSETPDYIRCLTRKRGGEWRIYTANINPHPNARVEVRLPSDIPPNATVDVLYENRALKAGNGVFTDNFDGFARHVYRIVK